MKRSNPFITCTVLSLMSMFMRYTNAKSYQVKMYIFFIWFSFYKFSPFSFIFFPLLFNRKSITCWRMTKERQFSDTHLWKKVRIEIKEICTSIFKEIFPYFHFHLWILKQLSKCRVGKVSGSVCSSKIISFFVSRAFYFVNILAWIERKIWYTYYSWTRQFV